MLAGFPASCPAGDHDSALIVGRPVDLGDGLSARLPVKAAANLSQYWYYLADGKPGAIFYAQAGVPQNLRIAFDGRRASPHTLLFAPLGLWSYFPPGFDPRTPLQAWSADKGRYLALEWDSRNGMLDFEAYDDLDQLDTWTATGLQRFTNCLPKKGAATEAKLQIEISTSGGDHTVTLSMNGFAIVEGTITGDGPLTLLEKNGSGVEISCELTYSADLALEDGAYLLVRWPKKYELYVDNVLGKTVFDNNLGNVFTARVGPKASGTYALKVRGVSDTDVNGSFSTPVNQTVTAPPQPPGAISLQETPGDYTNTAIQFDESPSNPDGYHVYDVTELDGPVNMLTPITPASLSILSGVVSVTLPDWGTAEAGKRTIVVMAHKSGIEDGYGRTIVIEYDAAGAIVPGRPNPPKAAVSSRDGLDLTVALLYDPYHETTVGLEARLFLVAEGDTPDYASPDAVANLSAQDGKGYRTASLTATAPAAGLYQWIVRVSDANDPTLGNLSPNTELQEEVKLSDAAPGAPSSVSARVEA